MSIHDDYPDRKPNNQSTVHIKLLLPADEWRNVGIAGHKGGRRLAHLVLRSFELLKCHFCLNILKYGS